MTAHDAFQSGRLSEAIQLCIEGVRDDPTNIDLRAFLVELLCFNGELERADKQLDTISTQNPETGVVIALFRQLVRAEQARQDFFEEGRLPDVLDEPNDSIKLVLKASICLNNNETQEAIELLTEAEEKRREVNGTCNDQEFSGFRDLDDFCASFLEVFTSTGKYYWIPTDKINRIHFRPAEKPRDLLWRETEMDVRDGPDGVVYLPCLYWNSHKHDDEAIRLGRATDWVEAEEGLVRGLGQKIFLAGDEDLPIMQINDLVFATQADD
jgi:type VI secretion system protein ImpE